MRFSTKSICLGATILVSSYISAQDHCLCSQRPLIERINQTKLEDSTSVFELSQSLKSSAEKACIFFGLSLEIDYLLVQKRMEQCKDLLSQQRDLLNGLACEAELLGIFKLNQAKFYHKLNDFDNLSKFALEALILAEAQEDIRLEIEALKELVWLYTRIDEDDKLWDYVQRGKQLILDQTTQDLFTLYDYRWLAYEYESRFARVEQFPLLDTALVYTRKAQKIALAYQYTTELTKVYRALEAIAYHQGELENALNYIDTAIYYGKKIQGEKNLSGLYLSKAWDHYDLGQLNEVQRWTDTMLARDTKADIGGYMMMLSQAAELYELSGDLEKAYQSFKGYATLKDSLFNVDRLQAMNELEVKYQSEIKDKELALQELKIKRLSIYIIVVLALGILFLLFSKMSQLRKVKKMNTTLEEVISTKAKLEQEIMHVKENIAQDFHDELGNKLARISLLSNLIKDDQNLKDNRIKSKLIQITEDAKTLYLGTRDFIFSLKPNSDDLEEVVTYLSDFGEDYFSKTAIKFQLEKSIEKDIQLPYYWSKQLIFIFKEAMTNALKHADCSQVKLQFQFVGQELKVEFEDNGKGIPSSVLNSNNGLANMRKRARKIGGLLKIELLAPTGTKISFTGITTSLGS